MRSVTEQPDQSSSCSAAMMLLARLLLVGGGDGVLEVEHDDVGAEARRLGEHAGVAAGDGELGAVQAEAVGGMGGAVCGRPARRASGDRANSEARRAPARSIEYRRWVGAKFFGCARSRRCGTLLRHADPDLRSILLPGCSAAPGPSDVEPSVLAAMRRPMLGHLDPDFHAILDEVVAMLRAVWRMPDGRRARAARHRHDGDGGRDREPARAGGHRDRRRGRLLRRRLADMAERQGAHVVRVTAPLGQTVPNAALLDALDAPSRGAASSPSCTPRPRRARSIRCASSARRSPATTRC